MYESQPEGAEVGESGAAPQVNAFKAAEKLYQLCKEQVISQR